MSVRVEFDLADITPVEATALMNMLESLTREKDAVRRPVPSQAPVAVPFIPAAPVEPLATSAAATEKSEGTPTEASASAPASEAKRRGRPKKEVAPEPEASAPAPVLPSAPSPDVPTKSHTEEEIRNALLAFTEKKGMNTSLALVAEFGCARVSEVASLDPEKQQAFMDKCNG